MSPIRQQERQWIEAGRDVTVQEVFKDGAPINPALNLPRDPFTRLQRETCRLMKRIHDVLTNPELTLEGARRSQKNLNIHREGTAEPKIDVGIYRQQLLIALNSLLETLPAPLTQGVYTIRVQIPGEDVRESKTHEFQGVREPRSELDFTQILPILDTEIS